MKEYKLGDIFTADEEYSERAKFCNENGLMIAEIDPIGGERRFQIQEVPPIPKEELIKREIRELKRNLASTDYQAIKYAEGELSEEEFRSVKERRKEWRARINELEGGAA